MRSNKILMVSGVLLGLSFASGGVDAQQAEIALEEVIVTAQRREEALLETPLSVTAISGDIIERQNVRELSDLVPLIPGFDLEPDANRTSIRIRGIATSDGAPAAENIAALHVDGVYVSTRASLAGYFYDLQRVEVLQGPQGTLYGRNTAAGSLNIISNRPVDELAGSVDMEAGSYDLRRLTGMLNLPVSDTLALRGAFQSAARDGYFSSNIDETSELYGRLGIQWDPSDRVSLYTKIDFADRWRRGVGVAVLGTVDNSDPDNWRHTPFDEDTWYDDRLSHPGDLPSSVDGINNSSIKNQSWGIMTELTAELTDNTSFIAVASRIEEEWQQHAVDAEGFLTSVGAVYGGISTDRVLGYPWLARSLDARFQGSVGDVLDWTVGYFGWDSDTNSPHDGNPIAFHTPISLAESDALYGQVTWTPGGGRFHLTAGARRTEDWKQWDFQVVFKPFDVIVGGSGGLRTAEWDNDDFKVGVSWDVGDDSLIYSNISSGFRAGSWFPGPVPQYNPEYVDAFEIGWKGRLADDRLELAANAYYYEFTDMAMQFTSFNTLSGEDEVSFANLGNSEILGFNVSGVYLPSDADVLTFNVDYTNTEIVSFDFASVLSQFPPGIYSLDAVFDWTGLPLVNTPEWRLTGAWTRTFNLGNGATVESRLQGFWNDERFEGYRDDTLVQYEFAGYHVDSYLTVDWNVRYQPGDENWYLGFYVRNITDETIIHSVGGAQPGGGSPPEGTLALQPVPNGDDAYLTGQLRAPRTVGFRFGYAF